MLPVGPVAYRNEQTSLPLMFPALFGGRPSQLDQFRHLEAYLFLNNLEQGYVGCAQVAGVGNEWTAHSAPARVQLPDTA